MTFTRTSAESNGQSVEFDLELRPLGAPGGLPHWHLPTERFEVKDGTLFVWIAGHRPRFAGTGDVIEVPSCRWHFIIALGRAHADVSVRPGMRFDELLATFAAAGKGNLRPSVLGRLASLVREHVTCAR